MVFQFIVLLLVGSSACFCAAVFDRWMPDVLTLVVFFVIIWAIWRWFFEIWPRKKSASRQEKAEMQLARFRQKLAGKPSSGKNVLCDLAKVALPKLADALTEHILNKVADNPNNDDHRNYVLADINSVLQAAGAGAEIQPFLLNQPLKLRVQLRASLEIPVQILAKKFPNRLRNWLNAEPIRYPGGWAKWVEEGRVFVNQAHLNRDEAE
jgi:hypothetical protein